MKKHEDYVNEKTLEAYHKYLDGEYFVKARAIILKDGLVAFIKDLKTDKITVPGGGVEENETVEQGAVREAKEETGINVKPIMPVGKEYYDVPMRIGDVEFDSKRVAYAYLCEYESQEEGFAGLDGEYQGMIEIFFDEIDKLRDCNIGEDAIKRIKTYLENKSTQEK